MLPAPAPPPDPTQGTGRHDLVAPVGLGSCLVCLMLVVNHDSDSAWFQRSGGLEMVIVGCRFVYSMAMEERVELATEQGEVQTNNEVISSP